MAKAKKAQEEARADVITTASATPVKKRTFKVAAAATAAATAAVTQETATVAAKVTVTQETAATQVKTKRQPKKVIATPTPMINPLATESTEPPLQDISCIIISVRKIEHAGRKYYLNSEKDKLYAMMSDGGVGKYCGRFDRENDRIADFPDSDSER
jgi:hypothetical protein